jgi:hypothetical protein
MQTAALLIAMLAQRGYWFGGRSYDVRWEWAAAARVLPWPS